MEWGGVVGLRFFAMKTVTNLLLFAALCGSVLADGQAKPIRVVGNSKLQLGIVDTARATPARAALHAAFAAGLGKAMSAACGGPVEVQAKTMSADQAAFGLEAGSCQVVLTMGKALPRPLVRSELERLNATLGAEKNEKKAYLVFTNADEGLRKLLTASFASAITDQQFLDAFDGGIENAPEPTAGKTLASAGP
jgi:hypothetical protein